MQVSRSSRETSVFILKWEDVTHLYSRLAADFSSVNINAICADGLKRKFSDLDELKKFSNAKRVEIKSLGFDAKGDSYQNQCSISFESGTTDNVRFSVDGREVPVTSQNSFYLDLLDSIRPWYSRVAVFDFAIAVVVFGLVSLFGLVLFAWFKGYLKAVNGGFNTTGDVIISLAGGVLIMLVATVLNHFKGKFFPMGVFAFGDGLKRHENAEVIRTVVIGGFMVSIAASIFYSFFSR